MYEVQTYDGWGNNIENPEWGAADQKLLRRGSEIPDRFGEWHRPRFGRPREPEGYAYNDGVASLARGSSTNPRVISNLLCKETGAPVLDPDMNDTVWAWGQYLDHEIDITPEGEGDEAETANILIPSNDGTLAAGGEIQFTRSAFDPYSSTDEDNPREQRNNISSYVDATNVYGNSANRVMALRALDGTGKLKTGANNLLPFNTDELPNAAPAGADPKTFFVSGDIRANETAVLASMHTLFMREHNRLCDEIANNAGATLPADPIARDEHIFQAARRVVSAIEQSITYNEFLPALLGAEGTTRVSLDPYYGYRRRANAGIDTLFSTACFRLGHSMLSETVQTPGANSGTTDLKDMFFQPDLLTSNGIEPYLGGLASQNMRKIDTRVVEAVRSFLFGPPTNAGLLDLAALNIQRGRDHGLPDYNTCRDLFDLRRRETFEDITGGDAALAAVLSQAYGGNINIIDPWIGGLAEPHVPGAHVGRFIGTVLHDQFTRARSGDRFWYERDPFFNTPTLQAIVTVNDIRNTKLGDVVNRNTSLTVPANMFT
jgi:peroxidase